MSYPSLHLWLHAANRRALFIRLASALLLAVCVVITAVVGALLLDAALALGFSGLVLLDITLLCLGMTAIVSVGRLTWRHRFHPARIARMIEQQVGADDSVLINAVDLQQHPRRDASAVLVRRSVERGMERAQQMDVRQIVGMAPLRRAVFQTALLASVVCVAYAVAPAVFGRGITRLLDPAGDHPPFTTVKFDIRCEPSSVSYGLPARITAQLSGPDAPDTADVVFVDQDQRTRVPMAVSDQQEFQLPLDRVERSLKFYVDTPKGRSETHQLNVIMIPRFESARVTCHYPDYTDWPSRSHALAGREIRALVGTRLEFEFVSNMPLASGEIAIVGGDVKERSTPIRRELKPSDVDPRLVHGTWTLTRSGVATVKLVGQHGETSLEPFQFRVAAEVDRFPAIQLIEPEPVTLVVEGWPVTIRLQADDDVQISGFQLHAALNAGPNTITELDDRIADRKRAAAEHRFDLEAFGARAGDRITYHATAQDNCPGEPQVVETAAFVLRVISQEEYSDFLRRSHRMEELLEELEQLRSTLSTLRGARQQVLEDLRALESLQQGTTRADSPEQSRDRLTEDLGRFAERTQSLERQLGQRLERPQLYESEASYREALEGLADQMRQQTNVAKELSEAIQRPADAPSSLPTESHVPRLSDPAVSGAIENFRRQEEPFGEESGRQFAQETAKAQQLQQADRLLTQADRLQDIIRRQQQLADDSQPFDDEPNLTESQRSAARRFARQQDLTRQELLEITEALEQAAQETQAELPRTSGDALRACESVRQMAIPQDQDRAAQAARTGRGTAAHRSAAQAADKLKAIQSRGPGAADVAEEIDERLGSSESTIRQSLQQLSQSRRPFRLPAGLGDSQVPEQREADAWSRFSVRGPQTPQSQTLDGRTGRTTAEQTQGRGSKAHVGAEQAGAEWMDVQSKSGVGHASGNLRGVPMGYRDQAEAYFRRLAEPD